MKKFFVLVAVLALFAPAAFAADIHTQVMKGLPGWGTEAPTDLFGDNQIDDGSGLLNCCGPPFGTCAQDTGSYVAGDTILLNQYHNEVLTDDGAGGVPTPWVVDYTVGLRLPSGAIFSLLPPTPVDFGDLNAAGFFPGDELIFCVTLTGITLPGACAGGADVGQGFIVDSTGVGGGVGGPAVVNNFICL